MFTVHLSIKLLPEGSYRHYEYYLSERKISDFILFTSHPDSIYIAYNHHMATDQCLNIITWYIT